MPCHLHHCSQQACCQCPYATTITTAAFSTHTPSHTPFSLLLPLLPPSPCLHLRCAVPCLACHQCHQSPPCYCRCPLHDQKHQRTPRKLSLLTPFIDIPGPHCVLLLISPFSLSLTSSALTFTSYRHSCALMPYTTCHLCHSLHPLTPKFSSMFIYTAVWHVAGLTFIFSSSIVPCFTLLDLPRFALV